MELDFYYLRTPTLSLQRLLDLLQEDDLPAYVQENLMGEAIFLASPTLYNEFLADPTLSSKKLRQTALKYVLRMGSRSTPFGLFAGCSLGQIADRTDLNVSDRQLFCHYELNMTVIWELTHYLNQHSEIRSQIPYQVNSSLYSFGNQFRYLELEKEHTQIRFFTSQIANCHPIRWILRKARKGATIAELIHDLIGRGYPIDQAQACVDQLIIDQVLVSQFVLNGTGVDPLQNLIGHLQSIPKGKPWVQLVRQVQVLLMRKDSVQKKHTAIQSIFKKEIGLSLPDASIIQGNSLFTGKQHQLSRTLLTNLQKAIQKLFSLSNAFQQKDSLLLFKRKFYARYEEREIPLALALDAESGIGYGDHPFMGDNLMIQTLIEAGDPVNQQQEIFSPELDHWLRNVYNNWFATGNSILELTDTDLNHWSDTSTQLPASYYVFGYFLSSSSQALDRGDYRFRCKFVAGPSAFPLLGRFCRVDQQLEQKIQNAFKQLQKNDPNRVYAEIVHIPIPAIGNVVQRPHMSEYEISYLGHSTLPIEKQISIDDLWISIPKGERVVLRSRRLGKEIVPRLTTAHNYQNGLPIYRFLCDLQQQESELSIYWHWGGLSNYRFLPRVQYRQIILQEARWRLTWSDYQASLTESENVSVWRLEWKWPRFISIAQADQELFLDLEHEGCQQLLINTLRRLQVLQIFEWLRTPDQCPIDGPDGKLTHEVILPFLHEQTKPMQRASRLDHHGIARNFIPGSEWLYLKVYCGTQASRKILLRLGKLARIYIRSKKISHWFFIRYQDPEPHLRFRFHLISQASYNDILSDCQRQLQSMINTDEIYRVQLDTYQREIERYGAERIVVTECLFWVDSDAVLTIARDQLNEQMRLAVGLLGVDKYLDDFNYPLSARVLFYQQGFQIIFDQQGSSVNLRKQLAILYRQNQGLIEALCAKEAPESELYSRYHKLFKKRSSRNKTYLNSIFVNQPQSYISSLIHLYVNRLFDQHQIKYELIIYHHLYRFYQSYTAQSN
ncbi:lantibiotic dehydratase [Spirosoma foliorum]|uniref:Lantibiotic dehydratase n=1 Tax=Spirosoma foliorum TaxID=2710596 RepID=A0A7G5H2V0_9BACT|nr:lantibiotic dehydratase [Spirosoma foliorum]QMW05442.1 lantibiotic dehydratase [Spirosoma foliorum]